MRLPSRGRKRVLTCATLLGLVWPAAEAPADKDDVRPVGPPARLEALSVPHSAWQLAWVDPRGDGRMEIAYSSFSGRLSTGPLGGPPRWSHDLGAFVYAISACDLDGDGAQELLVTSAGRGLTVFDAAGRVRWTFDNGKELYALACGRLMDAKQRHVAVGGTDLEVTLLDGQGKKVRSLPFPFSGSRSLGKRSIRFLAAGDTDADGRDELLIGNYFARYALVDPRTGRTLWEREAGKPDPWLYNGRLFDVTGDGKAEAVIGGRMQIHVVGPDGDLLFEKLAGRTSRGYRMVTPFPLDLDGDGTYEIGVSWGPELTVFDAEGRIRYGSTAYELPFNAAAVAERSGSKEVLLASVTGSDRNVYRVTLGGAKRDEIAALVDPPGHRRAVHDALRRIREQVIAAPVDEASARPQVRISLGTVSLDPARLESLALEQQRHAALYPYPNVDFYHIIGVREAGTGGKTKGLSRARLFEVADRLESLGVKHVLQVGHSDEASVRLETLAGWLDRTPSTSLGLRVSELSIEVALLPDAGGQDELRDDVLDYFEKFLIPAIDQGIAHGKPSILLMKSNWWVLAPASSRVGAKLFSEARRGFVVPSVEGSNARSPEFNLMGRVGLWQRGLVRRWATRFINDGLRTDRRFEYQIGDPSHPLRQFVAYAAAGASDFDFKPRYLFLAPRGVAKRKLAPKLEFNDWGLIAFDLFVHLVGKGLLDIPTPDTIGGLSPVEIRMREPARSFTFATAIRKLQDPPTSSAASAAGLLSGFEVPYLPTRDPYAPSYLLDVRHYGNDYYPADPWGLPVIVPDRIAPAATGTAWVTDGESVWQDGKKTGAAASRAAILHSFEQGAASLPLRAEGVYWMSTRRKDGSYRVTLLDPSALEPETRNARLVTAKPIKALRDVIEGTALPFSGKGASVTVPAGAFRIVDVRF